MGPVHCFATFRLRPFVMVYEPMCWISGAPFFLCISFGVVSVSRTRAMNELLFGELQSLVPFKKCLPHSFFKWLILLLQEKPFQNNHTLYVEMCDHNKQDNPNHLRNFIWMKTRWCEHFSQLTRKVVIDCNLDCCHVTAVEKTKKHMAKIISVQTSEWKKCGQ